MSDPLRLSDDDVELLRAALDAYEYWELGRDLPRSDGLVFIPGDSLDEPDRFWATEPTADEAEAIELIHRCRALAARLS